MKKALLLCLALAMLILPACTFTQADTPPSSTPDTGESTSSVPPETEESTATEATQTETTFEESHSAFYLPEYTVEDVILYFNEVCLQAEYSISGDPSLLQKWTAPITYYIHGEPTDQDLAVVNSLVQQLNAIEGFPGIRVVQNEYEAVLPIYFCTKQELSDRMGSSTGYEELDGAVTFWYNGAQEITDAIICIRTDLPQSLRNSVILEEIYNGLGPIQDTVLRPDSIIYQNYSETQSLSSVDTLILQLLYHPQMQCGMTAEQCESVIRTLYY